MKLIKYDVKCKQCGSTFSVAHGSQSDIGNHLKCTKHKKALTAITGFFKKEEASDADLQYRESWTQLQVYGLHVQVNQENVQTEVLFSLNEYPSNRNQHFGTHGQRKTQVRAEQGKLHICRYLIPLTTAHEICARRRLLFKPAQGGSNKVTGN